MIQVKTFKSAKIALEEGNVLVYKPYAYKPIFLVLNKENKIAVFNENLRYTINFEELENLLDEFNLFIFEKDNGVEIDEEFRNIRQ